MIFDALSGTILNAVAVAIGTTIGLVAAARVSAQLRESLTTGLGLFTLAIAMSMALQVFQDPAARPEDSLAVLGGLLLGVAVGEWLRLHDRLEGLGAWFQRRLASSRGAGDRPTRVAEAFVTTSVVFCIGPLTILGSLDNGLRGDITLLATKSLLDGVASVAFAAALGAGVYLSIITVLVVQGGIALGAFLLQGFFDEVTILVVTAVAGVMLLGVGLRLLDLKQVRLANFLPGIVLAPVLIRLFDAARAAFS
ncbi:MAG TPA: DUF554 domain-containing protein [Candidatus Binatia bacterium]|nr:DUF554 domain-containing protein [Candidatus Binatia bacterium]